ncbi:MAG: sugar kinase [Spirochaetes bacterium]|nr:sugar kinase [Spirochaetota bacterium]
MADVITFGEAMIRLTPPGFQKIEQSDKLKINAGGAELNVAVALSRLGSSSGWVSCLPENPLGNMISNKAREHNVLTDHIVWEKEGRAGLYFYEMGASPRPSSVLYDRAHSCMSGLDHKKLNYEKILKNAKWFHTTGITPALGDGCRKAVSEFLKRAKELKLTTSYDLNFRKKLWTEETAQKVQEEMMKDIDILISTEEDIERVFKIKDPQSNYHNISKKLIDKFKFKIVCITIRENISVWKNNWSAVLFDGKDFLESDKYEVEVVDRIGAGDSFTAGLIHSLLSGKPHKEALNFAVAFSALKHSIPGDFNLATKEETENLLKNKNMRVQR